MSVKIDQAFVKAFIDADFGLPIAHENLHHTPSNQAYAELLMLTNDSTPLSLSDCDETDGVFRVLLHYPKKGGAIDAKTMAGTIMSAFKIGSRVCYEGTCATVVAQQRQAGAADEVWYKLVLTFRYRAFLRRN